MADGVQYDVGVLPRGLLGLGHGVLLYALGTTGSATTRLAWIDRAGKPLGEPFGEPAEYSTLAVSPDGKRIAAGINDATTGTASIWLFDGRGVRSRFTFGDLADVPNWSRDGSRIAFQRVSKQAIGDIHVKASDGAGEEITVFHSDRPAFPSDWSPDGKFLAVDLLSRNSPTKGDIWMAPLSGGGKPYPFLATEFNERGASFSGDGKWVCYISDESGRDELYVVPFPGPGSKWQVSTAGTLGGGFFKDGKEIIYGNLENELVSVEIKAGAAGIEVGPPKVLMKLPPFTALSATQDGERILIAAVPLGAGAPRVAIVTNWTAGFEKK